MGAMSRGLCLSYVKFGWCRFGEVCRFLHQDDASDASSTTVGDECHPGAEDWSLPQALEAPPVPTRELSDAEEKEVRKAEKKLREIAKIELLILAGEKVDSLQVKKVDQKRELMRQV